MWSFQGSSYDWGKDDVQKLTRTSSQPNAMGEAVKGGYGGGIPVVAFWTASVGEAIGHVETLAVDAVDSGEGGSGWTGECEHRRFPSITALKPGESYSTPRSFRRRLQRRFL